MTAAVAYKCGKCGKLGHNARTCARRPRYPRDARGFADIKAVMAGAMRALRPTPDEIVAASRLARLSCGLSYKAIALQDGVTVGKARRTIVKFARLAHVPVPAMRAPWPRPSQGETNCTELAKALGIDRKTLTEWADKGLIPSIAVGEHRLFSESGVRAALDAHGWSSGRLYDPSGSRGQMARARDAEQGTGLRTCPGCRKQLPLDDYPPSSLKKKSGMCRLCKQAYTRASDMKRRRKMKATQSEPVRIALVAERDGWRCGICRGRVTRATWSLDHVVPISKGGAHTYANVTLAHLECNTKRGVDRLPVQAPLFAHMGVAPPRVGHKGTSGSVRPLRVAEPRRSTRSSD